MAGPKNGDGDAVRRPGPVTAADPFQLLADLHAALRDGRWDGPRGILFTEILRCARALLGPDEAGHAAPCVGAGGPAQGPSQTGPAPSASPSAASAPPSPPQLPRAALPTFLEAEECAAALGLVEGMYDVLTDLQWLKHRRPSEPRSSDGILQVDHGVFPLLRDCKVPSLREALADIDLVAHARAYYWMCPGCGRPTSEPYYSHMRIKHPAVRALPEPPPPLCAAEVLDAVAGRPFPACTVYSMESPVYRACNRSMRDWHRARDAFATWQGFACLLDFELHQLKRFVGTVYRATPVQVPPSLYQKGNVVTWNHPSSTSSDARVAKMFLGGGDGGALKGSIFIIQSVTGRPIGEHSVYPREAEVLFRAGTQFQVKSQTPTGLKSLLESTMRCSLRSVDVYEVCELTLDSWRDVAQFLEPADALRNRDLLEFLQTLPTQDAMVRNQVKAVCAPMSELPRRAGDGTTPLHLGAVVPDNLPCLHLVGSRLGPADFSRVDASGCSALDLAVQLGHAQTAVFLMERGAAYTGAGLKGGLLQKAVPWVACHGSVELLRRVCVAVEGQHHDLQGLGAGRALQKGLFNACRYRGTAAVEVLLERRADIAARDARFRRCSALSHAARAGNAAVVGLLLDRGADVHAASTAGGTALMEAAHHGHREIVSVLLRARADVHAARTKGWTAVMLAAERGHADVIQALVQAQADVQASTGWGATALTLAAQNGHLGAIEALLRAQADVHATGGSGGTALLKACENGHLAVVQALLRAGADARAADGARGAALARASERGHLAVMQTLLQRTPAGAADALRGHMALHVAVAGGHAAAIAELLGAGADAQATDDEGTTALMIAARRGDTAAIQALLQAQADVRAANHNGRTALMEAARQGHVAALRALLQGGALVMTEDRSGRTAFTQSKQHGHAEALAVLREALCGRFDRLAPG